MQSEKTSTSLLLKTKNKSDSVTQASNARLKSGLHPSFDWRLAAMTGDRQLQTRAVATPPCSNSAAIACSGAAQLYNLKRYANCRIDIKSMFNQSNAGVVRSITGTQESRDFVTWCWAATPDDGQRDRRSWFAIVRDKTVKQRRYQWQLTCRNQ